MQGLEYVGFSTRAKKIKQNTIRAARTIRPSCSSNCCKIRKERHCARFEETIRLKIFKSFRNLSWDAKQMFVQCSVKTRSLKTTPGKKKFGFKYCLFLNVLQVLRRYQFFSVKRSTFILGLS